MFLEVLMVSEWFPSMLSQLNWEQVKLAKDAEVDK